MELAPLIPIRAPRMSPMMCLVGVFLALESFALVTTLGFPMEIVGYFLAGSAALTLVGYFTTTRQILGWSEGVFLFVALVTGAVIAARQFSTVQSTFVLFGFYFLATAAVRIISGFRNFENLGWPQVVQGVLNLNFAIFILMRWREPAGWVLGTALVLETLQMAATSLAISIVQGRPSQQIGVEEFRRAG